MNAFPVSVTCYTLIFYCLLSRLPLSLQIVVPFLHKVFLQSTYWVKSLPQLVFHFSSRFPSSRAPLYTRRARVSIYMFSLASFSFPSSLKCSQQFFFLPLVGFLYSFSPLSIPLCSFSPCFLPVEHTIVSLSGFSPS